MIYNAVFRLACFPAESYTDNSHFKAWKGSRIDEILSSNKLAANKKERIKPEILKHCEKRRLCRHHQQ